jgi:predicted MFS family arabinose efflux permease
VNGVFSIIHFSFARRQCRLCVMSNATTLESVSPAQAWTSAWAALAALAVAMGVGRFAFTPILPMMQDDAGLSVPAAGWLASANYVGYLAGALSAIVMRVRPAIAIRAGLVLIGVSTLAMGVTQQFAAWIALRAAAGIASAWVLVFVSAWALDRLARARRADLGGVVYAGVGTGIAIAGGAGLVAMRLHARSAEAWLLLGALSIAVTAALWPLIAPEPSARTSRATPVAKSGVARAEFWRLVLCYGAFGFGYIVPATFLPLMAKQVIADPAAFGWAWPLFGAAAIASTVLAARLGARVAHRAVWIGGHLVMAAGVVIPLVVQGLAGILAGALLVGGTFMVVTMAGIQEARRIAGAHAQTLVATMTASFATGQLLGPLVVGVIVRTTGTLAPVLLGAAALLVLSAVSLLPFTRKEIDA